MTDADKPQTNEVIRSPKPSKRRWWRRFGWLLLAAVLCVALLLVLLFATGLGRRAALYALGQGLGANVFQYEQAEGSLASGMRVTGMQLNVDGARIHLDDVLLDVAPWSLFSRTLDVERLQASGVRVEVMPSQQPPSTEPTPWVLPVVHSPVAVRVRQLGVAQAQIVTGEQTIDVASAKLSAMFQRSGLLVAEHLSLQSNVGDVSGDLRLAFDGGRNALGVLTYITPTADKASATLHSLPLESGGHELRLQLSTQGDTPALVLTVPKQGQWQAALDLQSFDAQAFIGGEPSAPISVSGLIAGDDTQGKLDLSVNTGDTAVTLRTEAWRIEDAPLAWAAEQLRVGVNDDINVVADARLELEGSQAFTINGRLQPWRLGGDVAAIMKGDFALEGTPDAYQARFDGDVTRTASEPATNQQAQLLLRANGDRGQAKIESLRVTSPVGTLSGVGQVGWVDVPSWQMDVVMEEFDPSHFASDYPGRLNGALRVSGSAPPSGLRLEVLLNALEGQLRGRSVSGAGRVVTGMAGQESDIQLAIGDSRIQAKGNIGLQVGQASNLHLDLSPLRLDDVLPEAQAEGRLNGSLRVMGSVDAPSIQADVTGKKMRYQDMRMDGLTLKGDWHHGASKAGAITLAVHDALLSGQAVDAAKISLSGTDANHQLGATLHGEQLTAVLAASGSLQPSAQTQWQGKLSRADITLPNKRSWRLQGQPQWTLAAQGIHSESTCLNQTSSPASLCVQASVQQGGQGVDAQWQDWPLKAWLALSGQNNPDMRVRGDSEGKASFVLNGAQTTGTWSVGLPSGSVNHAGSQQKDLLTWRGVRLNGELGAAGLTTRLQGQLNQQGSIDATLTGSSPLANPNGAVTGQAKVRLDDLRFVELLSPDLVAVTGKLSSDVGIRGTWNKLAVQGGVSIDDLGAEVPAMGLVVQKSSIQVTPTANAGLTVTGRINTGDGVLNIEGSASDLDQTAKANIKLTGDSVRVANTGMIQAWISPDVTIGYHAANGLDIKGKVLLPKARMDLTQMESRTGTSPDVVVMDAEASTKAEGKLPVRATVAVTLGDDVDIEGFGFDGGVQGALTVRERPGKVTTARGRLDVTGTYQAYGQDLTITRGTLAFVNAPLDNPALDVRAKRKIGQQTVGVRVLGTALSPDVSLWSNPQIEQSEALSYLVLGRPLRDASGSDASALNQAAMAAGGNLLAKRIGAKTGFDTFGVTSSEALGGSAFTVGKYLSPKLYVSYGVALFDSGSLLTMQYLLSRRWEVILESGQENRAGFNYRFEH